MTADQVHRRHAIIEQVNADLKHSALAHLLSGTFTSNAAWLVLAVIAFNLTRAAATISGAGLTKATTATIHRKIVTVPARVASSGRRIRLHLPQAWPWETGPGRRCSFTRQHHHSADHIVRPADPARAGTLKWNTTGSKARGSAAPSKTPKPSNPRTRPSSRTSVDRLDGRTPLSA